MKKFPFALVILILLTSCSTSDRCEDYACFTPPPAFIFEIVDKETGENLYSNGTLSSENIELLDEENENKEFQFIAENDLNVINLGIGWEPGTNSYLLILGPDLEIPVSINSEKKSENCCTFYKINHFSIADFEFEQSETTGYYKIFIE